MRRFVILEHDFPALHWDLMLECGAVLRTWRLGAPPAPGQSVRAEQALDHRRMYLDYEGPVGGERGRVRRWDSGTYRWEMHDPADADASGRLVLEGEKLKGPATLARVEGDEWALEM